MDRWLGTMINTRLYKLLCWLVGWLVRSAKKSLNLREYPAQQNVTDVSVFTALFYHMQVFWEMWRKVLYIIKIINSHEIWWSWAFSVGEVVTDLEGISLTQVFFSFPTACFFINMWSGLPNLSNYPCLETFLSISLSLSLFPSYFLCLFGLRPW